MSPTVAVVTGANKGIGFGLVKDLLQKLEKGSIVYLTARDKQRGELAVKELQEQGLNPHFHLLDISSKESISTFAKHIAEKHGGIDIFISNGAVNIDKDSPWPLLQQAEFMIKTNNFGTSELARHLIPLVREHGRVVFVSSGFGILAGLGESLVKRFSAEDLTDLQVDELLQEYLDAVRNGDYKEKGWADFPNKQSKVGIVALARYWAKQTAKWNKDILVNANCPGWTITEASRSFLDEKAQFNGIQAKTVEEAVPDVTYLALLPPGTQNPNGELVQYRKILPFAPQTP